MSFVMSIMKGFIMSKLTATVLTEEQFNEMFNVQLLQPTNKLSVEQNAILAETVNKSVKIRKLLASGMNRSQVAKALNIRYQHVRNVELTPLKKA
jgi:hypothetical protein